MALTATKTETIEDLLKDYDDGPFYAELVHLGEVEGKRELYRLIDEGLEDEKNGDVLPIEDAMCEIRKNISKR